MKPLLIEGTEDTPKIDFNPQTAVFNVSGKSLPESVTKFYSSVFEWIEQYTVDPIEETKLIIKLEYFNSASSKILAELLNLFIQIKEKGKELKIEWHYPEDDEEMLEAGQEYSEITKFPFSYYKYVFEDE